MRRSRKKQSPTTTLILWSAVGVIVIWGLWQAAKFRHALIAEPTPPPPTIADATTEPATTEPTAITESLDDLTTTPPPDSTAELSDGEEQWANAMTPPPSPSATIDDDDAPLIPDGASPDDLLDDADAALEDGRIVDARILLNATLGMLPDGPQAQELRTKLTALNAPVFLGSGVLPDDPAAMIVEIEPGDSFQKLGQRYAVPAALLQTINPNLIARNLKPSTGIKIVHGPFHLRMFKAAKRLDLYARNTYICSFPAEVSIGDYLPSGIYRIAAETKIQIGPPPHRLWLGIEGISPATHDVTLGWLYGDAGPRASRSDRRISGLKLRDADLATLYNVLVETRSLLRVEP